MGTRIRAKDPKKINGNIYPPAEYSIEPNNGPKMYPNPAKISAILIFYSIESGKSKGIVAYSGVIKNEVAFNIIKIFYKSIDKSS